jgi:hypothetical protein
MSSLLPGVGAADCACAAPYNSAAQNIIAATPAANRFVFIAAPFVMM